MDISECVDNMSLVDTDVNLEAAAVAPRFANEDKSCGIIIKGIHTDIVLKNYRNRTLLVLSQFRKFGSLITVTREETGKSDVYTIKTISGRDDDETHVAARYIAEQLAIDKPFLISICLKDYGVETLRGIVGAVKKIKSL